MTGQDRIAPGFNNIAIAAVQAGRHGTQQMRRSPKGGFGIIERAVAAEKKGVEAKFQQFRLRFRRPAGAGDGPAFGQQPSGQL